MYRRKCGQQAVEDWTENVQTNTIWRVRGACQQPWFCLAFTVLTMKLNGWECKWSGVCWVTWWNPPTTWAHGGYYVFILEGGLWGKKRKLGKAHGSWEEAATGWGSRQDRRAICRDSSVAKETLRTSSFWELMLTGRASCRRHLTEVNLLAQIGEGLNQSHTEFRAFPILLRSQPQGTKSTPLELTDSPLPQGRPLQRECHLSGTALPRLEEGEMRREEAAWSSLQPLPGGSPQHPIPEQSRVNEGKLQGLWAWKDSLMAAGWGLDGTWHCPILCPIMQAHSSGTSWHRRKLREASIIVWSPLGFWLSSPPPLFSGAPQSFQGLGLEGSLGLQHSPN